jgi:hypothetical protein
MFCESTEVQLLWILDQWECMEGEEDENTILKSLLLRICCNHCMVRVASIISSDIIRKNILGSGQMTKLFMWDEGFEVSS